MDIQPFLINHTIISRIEDLVDLLRVRLRTRKADVYLRTRQIFSFNDRKRFSAVLKTNFFVLFIHQDLFDPIIDDLELIAPVSGIEPRSHVVAVIVATFRIVEKARWKSGHFMPIVSIVSEKPLYFDWELFDILVGLLIDHPIEHRHWPKPLNFSQFSKNAQFSVCESHILLISLSYLSFLQGAELGWWSCFQHIINASKFVDIIEISQNFLQSEFREWANRVDVSWTAVVLCEVSSQGLIEVGRAKNQQETIKILSLKLEGC